MEAVDVLENGCLSPSGWAQVRRWINSALMVLKTVSTVALSLQVSLPRNPMPDLGLVGDVTQAVQTLLPCLTRRSSGTGADLARASRVETADLRGTLLANLRLVNLIRDTLPDALIVGDSRPLV